MLRITTHEADDSVVLLKLEGKLFEPWIAELRRSIQVPHKNLRLDLSALTFADVAGTRVLMDLIRSGATVEATSGFISALLQLEKS